MTVTFSLRKPDGPRLRATACEQATTDILPFASSHEAILNLRLRALELMLMRPKARSIQESREQKQSGRGERSRHDRIKAQSNGQRKQSEEGGRLTKAQTPKSSRRRSAAQASGRELIPPARPGSQRRASLTGVATTGVQPCIFSTG
jgi:hypothetical protein